MKSFLAQTRKAVGTAIVGTYAWGQFVVASGSNKITAKEWLMLGGVGVTVAAVYGLTNDPKPVPEPPVVGQPLDPNVR